MSSVLPSLGRSAMRAECLGRKVCISQDAEVVSADCQETAQSHDSTLKEVLRPTRRLYVSASARHGRGRLWLLSRRIVCTDSELLTLAFAPAAERRPPES